MRVLIVTIVIFTFIAFWGSVYSSESERSIGIEVLPASNSNADDNSGNKFGLALARWVAKNENVDSLPIGVYVPTFDALVYAYSMQIKMWRKLKTEEGAQSTYMNALVSIDDSGYLNEYVWESHSKYVRGEKPNGLREEEFRKWSAKNLVGHSPRIEARLQIKE